MNSQTPNPESRTTRCGFIALIGAPNAGKSTLLNRMVGAKVAIVTPKAQTTRNRVTGVCVSSASQLVFLDVPGVFNATQKFEAAMVASAWQAGREADVVLYLHDARKKPSEETEQFVDRVKQSGKPIVLALNKIDDVADKRELLDRIAWFNAQAVWAHIFLISARKGDEVDSLKQTLAGMLPEGPFLYDEDAMTDMPMRMMASELTREQCFMALQQELPYTLMVETESYEPRKDGSVVINQAIIVQNERQKGIVIGKGGSMLKTIGEKARTQIGYAIDGTCHLKLFVKVREDWKEKPEAYQYLGLDFKAGE
jgi:GTP-binding protein Era